ncbi:MAG: hypothetical protein KA537_00795 [Candidatus Moranbacteria bacterium]|nr:hypothetical protein [Candidatus Moranbacteria bacterium]
MKTLATKKNILILSGIVISVALLATEEFRFCYSIGLEKCPIPLDDSKEVLLYPFFIIFLLSLITYRMRDEVFQAWWRFARWFVPIIILVTFLQNMAHQQGGLGGVAQGAFDFAVLSFLYLVFILVSSIKIIRAHKR